MPSMMDTTKTAILKQGAGRSFKAGGPWIYDNEVDRVEGGAAEPGEIVALRDFDGYFLGYGFINPHSAIRIRILSRREDEPVTEELLRRRVRDALEYRRRVMHSPEDLTACRLIFGEADLLPGLTVDRFGDVLCVESLACGIDRLKGVILGALAEELAKDGVRLRGIYERSAGRDRALEGMNDRTGWIPPAEILCRDGAAGSVMAEGAGTLLQSSDAEGRMLSGGADALSCSSDAEGRMLSGGADALSCSSDTEGSATEVTITENGIRYLVDIANGQKTGFFLDQKYNRLSIRPMCRGARVLDCFTHTGAFALNAAAGGAAEVLGVDASEAAIRQAEANAALNGMSDIVRFQTADVFELLPALEREGQQYDVVILDPPAFTKSRASVKKAVTGYREINLRGMRLVRNGGYLATCTCSHFMEEQLFARTLAQAARGAHVRLRQVLFSQQAPDHPILWTGEENSYYLKFYIFQVFRET